MNQYIYDFGAISEETEDKYIMKMVSVHVSKKVCYNASFHGLHQLIGHDEQDHSITRERNID